MERHIRVVGACAVVFLLSGAAGAQEDSVPDDFQVKLRSAPQMPGSPSGPQSVTLESTGRVVLSEVERPDGTLPEEEIDLPQDALERIYQRIRQERFFELKPLYRDPRVADGDFAEMTVTANGQTHSVRTVNIGVHAFDRIVLTIDRELPRGRRIQYNALHVTQYEAVER